MCGKRKYFTKIIYISIEQSKTSVMLTGIHNLDSNELMDNFYRKCISDIFPSEKIELKLNNSKFLIRPIDKPYNFYHTRITNEKFEALQAISEDRLLCVNMSVLSLALKSIQERILLLAKKIDVCQQGPIDSNYTIKHSFLKASVIWLSNCILENTIIKADSLTLDYKNLDLCKNNKLNIGQLVIRLEQFTDLQHILDKVFQFYVDNQLTCPISFIDVNYQECFKSTIENGRIQISIHPDFHAAHKRKKLLTKLFNELDPEYKHQYTSI